MIGVGELLASPADHLQEPSSGVMVFSVLTQVLGEMIDPLGKHGDLDLGGAGVSLVPCVVADYLCFSLLYEHPALGPFRLSLLS